MVFLTKLLGFSFDCYVALRQRSGVSLCFYWLLVFHLLKPVVFFVDNLRCFFFSLHHLFGYFWFQRSGKRVFTLILAISCKQWFLLIIYGVRFSPYRAREVRKSSNFLRYQASKRFYYCR